MRTLAKHAATPRKVLILPSWYPRPGAPLEGVFIQDQAEVLARAFDVSVLAPRWVSWRQGWPGLFGPSFTAGDAAAVTVYRSRCGKVRPPLLRRLGLWPSGHSAETLVAQYQAAIEEGFARVLTRYGRPDVLHAHVVLPAGWVAARLGRRYGIPVVLTEHSGPFSVHLATPLQRRLVEETLTGVDQVLAVSPSLAGTMNEFCPGARASVLGNVVRTDFFTPAARSSSVRPRFQFFVAALLLEAKGVQFVLEAVNQLLRQGHAVELLIGGDGPYRPTLEALARRLGLTAVCRFLGMLTREQVREQMRRCDAFVLASRGETFGLVLGEAMACGKPVVATRCGGPEFVVTPETGRLVPSTDVGELATAMLQFIQQRQLFDPAVIRSSVTARFGEEVFLRNLTIVYEQLWQAVPRAA